MTKRESLEIEAMKLSPTDRADLVKTLLASLDDDLLDSLDEGESDELLFEDEWVKECERRMKAIESGEMGTVDAEEIIRRMQAGEMP
jgi:putative addiction module component (TIGR02574 family)